MENDENTVVAQDETQEGETVVVEETTTEDEGTQAEPESKPEGITLTGAELRHYNKWKASQKEPKVLPQKVSPQANVEELILQDKGMPDELIAELKVVAQLRKTSLIKAQNDPIFVAVKEKFEKDLKKKEASLPASRGAGTVKPKKDLTTPGLSREEHMQMVRELS